MSSLRIERLGGTGVDAPNLQVGPGECVALSGASGSGKTLLLRAIADLDESTGGVWLDDQSRDGVSGPHWRRLVGYLAAESQWWAPRVREHAATWRTTDLAALGFSDEVLDWTVQRLSSGERQRLSIARALAQAPQALLLDEPTANLDQGNTARVEGLIAAWRAQTGGCVLWVSHDPAQRLRVASRQYLLRDGHLEAVDGE